MPKSSGELQGPRPQVERGNGNPPTLHFSCPSRLTAFPGWCRLSAVPPPLCPDLSEPRRDKAMLPVLIPFP